MIANVSIQGFKNIEAEETLTLEKVTYFLGKNGVGKSTVTDAIKAALTGEISAGMVNRNTDTTNICLKYDDGTSIGIAYQHDKEKAVHSYGGKSGTKASVNKDRERICHMDPKMVDLLLTRSSDLFRSTPEEMMKIIAAIYAEISIDRDKLLDAPPLDLPEEAKDYARDKLPEKMTVTDLITFYEKNVKDELTAANRKVKDLTVTATITRSLIPDPGMSGEEIGDAETNLKKAITEVINKLAEVKAYEKVMESIQYSNGMLKDIPDPSVRNAHQRNISAAIPQKPDGTSVDLEELIFGDLALLNNAKNALEAQSVVETAEADAAGATAEQEKQQMLNDIFTPKGGKVFGFLLENLVGDFVDLMNEIADELKTGTEYDFEINKGVVFKARKTGESIFRSIYDLSEGERFISQLTMLTAAARACGFNYCVLDNLDCLDVNNFRKVCELITSPAFTAMFDNIVVCGVNHEEFLPVLKGMPVKLYVK